MRETQAPWPGRDKVAITSVRAIATAPEGIPLVVVRVDTSEPGLYGLGCATFTQRFHAVAAAVESHVAPLLIGRHPADIEDVDRLVHLSSYWRGGPVPNNALSGVDQALWDIAGKRAGMPVYEPLGGRVRAAADTYLHAAGATIGENLEDAQRLMTTGLRHVRLQTGADRASARTVHRARRAATRTAGKCTATWRRLPGTPVAVNGYLYPSGEPGWGVDLDEKLAARYAPETGLHERWAARVRRPDGGLESP